MEVQGLTPEKKRRRGPWEKAFFASLSRTGNVSASCRLAGVSRQLVYGHRTQHEDFAASWDDALDEAMDLLEKEAWRRAVKGLRRKKFTARGEPVMDGDTNRQYVEREYSDTLLIFLLKGGRPGKYRENHKVEVSGDPTRPLKVAHDLAPSALNAFAADLAAAGLGDVPEDGGGQPPDPARPAP